MYKFIFWILIFTIGCTQQPNKNVVSENFIDNKPQQVSVNPKTFTINQDSLKIFTPGKKGFH